MDEHARPVDDDELASNPEEETELDADEVVDNGFDDELEAEDDDPIEVAEEHVFEPLHPTPRKSNLNGVAVADLLLCLLIGIGGILILGTNGDRQKELVGPLNEELEQLRQQDTPEEYQKEVEIRSKKNGIEAAFSRLSYLAVLGMIGCGLGVVANLLVVNRRIEGLSLAWVTVVVAIGSIVLLSVLTASGADPMIAGPVSVGLGIGAARVCWNVVYAITLLRATGEFTAQPQHVLGSTGSGHPRHLRPILPPKKRKKYPQARQKKGVAAHGKKKRVR